MVTSSFSNAYFNFQCQKLGSLKKGLQILAQVRLGFIQYFHAPSFMKLSSKPITTCKMILRHRYKLILTD